MKNIYVAPKAEQINILSEGVVAASIKVDGDPNKEIDTNNPGSQLSNKRGWSSDMWTADEE